MKSSFNVLPLKVFGYVLIIILIVSSCDLFEKDAVPSDQLANLVQHDFYILPNSSAVFDLKSLVKADQQVSVSITGQPERGSLSKLTESIFKFEPSENFTSGVDRFVISFSRNGSVVKSDTVVIIVEQDTAQFPCELFAVEDLAFTDIDETVIIPVLQNDRVCNYSRSSIKTKVYTEPLHGQVNLSEDSIIYTPEAGYSGKDQFIYKISLPNDTTMSLGLVTVHVGDMPCEVQLNPDYLTTIVVGNTSPAIDLSVIANDQLCSIDSTKASFVFVKQPEHGTLKVVRFGHIQYTPSSPVTQNITDSLVYRICFNNKCYEAGVTLSLLYQACDFLAVNDSIDLRDSTVTGIIYIPILNNDVICGAIESLEFIDGPNYGTLYPYEDKFGYLPDPLRVENDSVTYRICNEPPICSEAKVYIIRK